jgi:hypothetical protein
MANNDNAKTHISVLLSTKTKKAHIQLVNRISINIHQIENEIGSSFSSSLLLKRGKASLNPQSQKISTNNQLSALILTAIVSFAMLSIEEIGVHREKKYAIYECHSPIILAAGQLFHRIIPWFSETTFGMYIYS